jgi:cytochrome c553
MGKCETLIVIILLCFSPFALGEGDPDLGKQKSLLCAECHGTNGNSPDKNIPKLAGQLEEYIVLAVTEFQQGIRKDPTMSNLAAVVQNIKDLEDIAAYFASQPKMQGQRKGNVVAAEGAELFTSERCNYCHSDEGKRYAPFQENIPPVIGGQHKPYLIKAMKDIKAGKRPGDLYGLMPRILSELSFKQIEAIAEYLSQI